MASLFLYILAAALAVAGLAYLFGRARIARSMSKIGRPTSERRLVVLGVGSLLLAVVFVLLGMFGSGHLYA